MDTALEERLARMMSFICDRAPGKLPVFLSFFFLLSSHFITHSYPNICIFTICARGLLLGEMSGSVEIPEEAMGSLGSVLEAMVAEKEVDFSIPVPEDIAPEEEIEPPTPVSEAVVLKAEVLGQEDIVVPTVEPVIPISDEGVGLIVERPSPGENVTPEAEVDIPSTSPKITAPIAVEDGASVLIADSPMELTQSLPLLAITQGSYRPR